jgi:predicted component of type VI protein secretion system
MRLVVQSGAGSSQSFELTRDYITIGRGSKSDILLSDESVSRMHCQLSRTTEGYDIQDANSANGTVVNGRRITSPHLLRAGDIIQLGNTTLEVDDSLAGATPLATEPITTAQAAMSPPASGWTRTQWALIGGIAALVIIVLVIAIVMLTQPAPAPIALAETSTRVPTPYATQTVSPVPSATATAPPASEAATPTLFANPLWTATPIITPSPTALPAKNYPLPVPTVLLPTPQAKYSTNAPIHFGWIAPDVLLPTEVYRVQIAWDQGFTQIACEIRTRETYVTVPGEGANCTDFWQFGQHYYWRVQIVLRDAPPTASAVSTPVGQIYEFTWAP